MPLLTHKQVLESEITRLKHLVDIARELKDPLRIELAMAALDDALDRYKEQP